MTRASDPPAAASSETEEPGPSALEEWTCVGNRRATSAAPTSVVFLDPRGRERWLPLTRFTRLYRLGGVYAVEVGADGRGVFQADPAPALLRLHDDEAQVALWQVLERAAEAGARAAKMSKSAGLDAVLAVLAPLRRAHAATDALGRVAIEAAVLGYLRGQPPASGE